MVGSAMVTADRLDTDASLAGIGGPRDGPAPRLTIQEHGGADDEQDQVRPSLLLGAVRVRGQAPERFDYTAHGGGEASRLEIGETELLDGVVNNVCNCVGAKGGR